MSTILEVHVNNFLLSLIRGEYPFIVNYLFCHLFCFLAPAPLIRDLCEGFLWTFPSALPEIIKKNIVILGVIIDIYVWQSHHCHHQRSSYFWIVNRGRHHGTHSDRPARLDGETFNKNFNSPESTLSMLEKRNFHKDFRSLWLAGRQLVNMPVNNWLWTNSATYKPAVGGFFRGIGGRSSLSEGQLHCK